MKKSVATTIAVAVFAAFAFAACQQQKQQEPKAAAPAQAVQKPMTSKAAEPKVPETPIKLGGH